jgi:hypothetical protein
MVSVSCMVHVHVVPQDQTVATHDFWNRVDGLFRRIDALVVADGKISLAELTKHLKVRIYARWHL